MRKLMVIVLLLAFAGNVYAEGLGIDFGVTGHTKYIWRGHVKTNDPVLVPEVGFKLDKLSLFGLAYMDTTNVNGEAWNFSEIDLIADFTDESPIKGLWYSIGGIYYDYPSTDEQGTWEVYGGLCLAEWPLAPEIKAYRDIDQVDGTYVQVAVKQNLFAPSEDAEKGWINLPKGINLVASVGWGDSEYNNFYWKNDTSNLNDLVLSATIPIEIAGISLEPTVSYIKLLDEIDGGAEDDDVVISLGLFSRSF